MGYLTRDKNDNLCIPNLEVFTELQEWLTNCNSFELNLMLNSLLQGELSIFKENLPKFITCAIGLNNLMEFDYHLFILGIFYQAHYHGYKLTSNEGVDNVQFDLKIEPTEKVDFKTGIYMKFKILNHDDKNEKLQNEANEALEQIKNNNYFSDFPEFTEQNIICGIAFQGKDVCIMGEVLNK